MAAEWEEELVSTSGEFYEWISNTKLPALKSYA